MPASPPSIHTPPTPIPSAPGAVHIVPAAGGGTYAEATYQQSAALNVNSAYYITINGRSYWFASSTDDVDTTHVYTGAWRLLGIQNLVKAINGTGTEPDVSSTTTPHADVRAEMVSESPSTPSFKVIARSPGSEGNLITVSETQLSGTWSSSTLTGGTDGFTDPPPAIHSVPARTPGTPPVIFTP